MAHLTDFFESDLIEYFEYLDDLRDSGDTNMFGGGAYLKRAFEMSGKEASTILLAWMDTFAHDKPPNVRVKEALKAAA